MLIYNLFIEFAVDKILICDMSANWGFFFSMSKDGSHCWNGGLYWYRPACLVTVLFPLCLGSAAWRA